MTSDVARLEGGVVGEQPEDHLAQHLDLAGAAVAGVHLHAAVARGQRRRGGRDAVGRPRSCCEPAEQRVGVAPTLVQDVVAARGAARDSCCSSSTSRDSAASSGLVSGRGVVVAAPQRQAALPRPCPTARARRGAATGARRGARRGRRAPAAARGSSRLAPNTESRSGRSLSSGWRRSRGRPPRAARPGSACEPVAQPPPQLGLPRRSSAAACRRRARPGRRPRRAASPAATGRTRRTAAPAGRATASRRPLSSASVPRCCASDRHHGSLGTDASMTSSSGHTERAGAHRSTASACAAEAACSASSSSVLGHGNSTLAQTPSPGRCPGRATAAAPATARRPWPAPPRPRPRTGRRAARRAPRPARGPAPPRGRPDG